MKCTVVVLSLFCCGVGLAFRFTDTVHSPAQIALLMLQCSVIRSMEINTASYTTGVCVGNSMALD